MNLKTPLAALIGQGRRFLSSRFGHRHDTRSASALNAIDLFEGEWITAIPGCSEDKRPNFYDDERIRCFDEQIGGFAGKRVIELGPLEASHTYMIANLGAADIIAVESNQRAFLRCLVVQNALRLRNTQFLLGDFLPYLETSAARADVIVACGVLYHSRSPLRLLEAMAKRCDTICLWTHCYDLGRQRRQFANHSTFEDFHGACIEMRLQTYDNQYLRNSCGGIAQTSMWLTRDGLLAALQALGFSVRIAVDDPYHEAGRAVLLTALR